MYVKILMLAFSFLLVMPLALINSRAADKAADEKFEALAAKYLEEMLALNPEFATALGEHRYDDRFGDYSLAGVARQREFNQRYLRALDAITARRLNRENSVDYRILRTQL